MIKSIVNVEDRDRRVKFADRLRNCGGTSTNSCECCGYAERTHLVEHYYEHDVLMCQYPGTEGLIVHDYGNRRTKNGGIHPLCLMCCDMPDPAPCPKPKPKSCNAIRIKDSYAQIHEDGDASFHYVLCPYCRSVNRLDDSTIGYRYCGWCEKLFNVK